MKINIGCGRFQFPTSRDNPILQHYQWCPMPDSIFDDEWVNIDKVDIPGVDQKMDAFKYPWPLADNSADEIWASHLVEHIPHAARLDGDISPELLRMANLDGWYAWHYEAWRVLRHGGILHIITPYAFSFGAMADPTHHRYLVPGSYSYFTPNPDAPFDYQIIPHLQHTITPVLGITSEDMLSEYFGIISDESLSSVQKNDKYDKLTKTATHRIDAVNQFYCRLKVIKDAD